MALSEQVESYKFWDVVKLWSKESLEHEEIVARALARAVVVDGLRLASVDMRWVKAAGGEKLELKGNPYIGYSTDPTASPMVLRESALQHLLGVVQRAQTPSHEALNQEFVTKQDFRDWLERTGQPLPAFWFGVAIQSA